MSSEESEELTDADYAKFEAFVEKTAAECRDLYWRDVGQPRKPWEKATGSSKQAWRNVVITTVMRMSEHAEKKDDDDGADSGNTVHGKGDDPGSHTRPHGEEPSGV